ncbi:putative prolyl 4-hydroxylase 4 [Vitis vinifera]|uniref:Putative prolyl 4-hydroxylase 4 n=1 Tax=Vitis vinifera TaxID=29760 RepID=A0A438KKD6_VITVI|nr:putative prolyl 4-hydroxylase 4 [Vitis vinifera]
MVSSLQFLLLLWISSTILEFSSSYADAAGSKVSAAKVRQISWKPRAFVYEGFLSEEECDHLISLAKSELKRSAVADNVSGKSRLSEVRTSSGMFIGKGKIGIGLPEFVN